MRRALASLLCLLLAGCAFTRRENRPLWNAFEQNLVPEDTGWFVAALPLTVPGGIVAILADTFVAHPIQVTGDAWDDAASLWRNGRPDFEQRYYSEMAFLPLRGVLTPLTFLGSFLGRSMFDVNTDEEQAEEVARRQATARASFAQWLLALQQGGSATFLGSVPALDDELRQALLSTRSQANALGRLQIYRLARREPGVQAVTDLLDGLRDQDPGVRFSVLESLPQKHEVPTGLQQQLKQDAVESIRLAAAARWPTP